MEKKVYLKKIELNRFLNDPNICMETKSNDRGFRRSFKAPLRDHLSSLLQAIGLFW